MTRQTPPKKRSIILYIILSFITLGFWGIVWFFKLASDLSRLRPQDNISPLRDFFLSLITFGLYSIYLMYKFPISIHKEEKKQNLATTDFSVVSVILTVLGMGIIPWCILQYRLNRLATKSTTENMPAKPAPEHRVSLKPPQIAGEGDFEPLSIKAIGNSYKKWETVIVGDSYKNPNGVPRRINFKLLNMGDAVFLYRQKNNEYDKNAIAVFPAMTSLSESNQLGFLSREEASEIAILHENGYAVTAKVSYLKEWFKKKDKRKKEPFYDCRLTVKVFVPDNASFPDLLRYRIGLPQATCQLITNAGISSMEELSRMTDAELSSFKGIGPKKIEAIKNALK